MFKKILVSWQLGTYCAQTRRDQVHIRLKKGYLCQVKGIVTQGVGLGLHLPFTSKVSYALGWYDSRLRITD